MYIFAMICFSAAALFVIVMFILKVSEDKELEKEISQVMRDCSKIESEKMDKGIAVFYPKPEDEYIYEILVQRKIMVKNPIGGYSFMDTSKRLFEPFGLNPENLSVIGVKRYEDDSGILKEGVDKDGNTFIVTEEDAIKEKEARKNGTS